MTLTRLSAIGVVALACAGCASVAETIKDGTVYRRDIQFVVNGLAIDGAGVAPKASSYQITARVVGSFDLLYMKSCHRYEPASNLGSSFGYVFNPSALEQIPGCPLEIRGIEKTKARDSWGFIDFQDDTYKLLAATECNGGVDQFPGVSVCQSLVGLTQRIDFQVPVQVAFRGAACAMSEPADHLHYVFRMPLGQCTYTFREIAGAHRLHRLTTLGYEDVVVRNI